MRSYWISKKNKNRAFFKRYAAVYKTLLPENADIITVTDDDEKVCAFSALSVTPGFAEIEFFYVFEEVRGEGYGRFMLGEILKALKDNGIKMLRVVLPNYEGYGELFLDAGFDLFPGEREYVVNFGSLRYSPLYAKTISGKNPENAKSVSECSDKEKRVLSVYFKENDIPEAGLDRDLSTAAFTEGELDAVILCEKKKEGIMIDYLHNNRSKLKFIRNCFRKLDSIVRSYGDEASGTKIYFATDNEKNKNLTKTLVGDDVQIEGIIRETVAIKDL